MPDIVRSVFAPLRLLLGITSDGTVVVVDVHRNVVVFEGSEQLLAKLLEPRGCGYGAGEERDRALKRGAEIERELATRRRAALALDGRVEEIGQIVRQLVPPGLDFVLIGWDGTGTAASSSNVPHERLLEVLRQLRGLDLKRKPPRPEPGESCSDGRSGADEGEA